MNTPTIKHEVVKRDTVTFELLDLPNSDYFNIDISFCTSTKVEEDYKKIYGKEIFGATHLLEHMSFKSTLDYNTKEVEEILRNYSKHNATTGFSNLRFFASTSTEHSNLIARVITNIAFNTLNKVTDEEFSTEKGVVLNELRRYLNDRNTISYFNYVDEVLYNGVGNNLMGTLETVENITLEDLQRLKAMLFTHNEITVSLTYDSTSDLNIEHLMGSIEKDVELMVSNLKEEYRYINYVYNNPEKTLKEPGKYILTDEEIREENSIIYITTDSTDNDRVRGIAFDLLNKISPDTSFKYYYREKHGITYGANISDISNGYNNNYTVFSVDVKSSDIDLAIELYPKVLKETLEVLDEELYNKVINKMILDEITNLNLNKHSHIFLDRLYEKETYEALKDITSSDLTKYTKASIERLSTLEKVRSFIKELLDKHTNNETVITIS